MSLDYLPNNATKFERALMRVLSDEIETDIRSVVDPDRTPLDFLPFLAGHESVDLWYEDWPIERKRLMVKKALELANLKGTRAAIDAYLPFVDAEVVHRVRYPKRFVIGRSALGLQPINHKPFTTHLLVKVPLKRPVNAFVIGRAAIGIAGLRTLDREPIRRVHRAIVVSKSPETLISVNTGHRRPVTVEDGFPIDGSFRLGGYINRERL